MSKQTALQDLLSQMKEERTNLPMHPEWVKAYKSIEMMINHTYLQMEREQIELAFDEGLEYEYEHHINGYPRIEPSTYYNETYGGKDE